ncbi:hypothetical protein [Mucilaginibacter phyllosphaerae]|uniref:Uncharacterized protein n=1 Tax=Mucilaginibacter phyllosphaerae TaxID=1812349 RepID=A0A4Y8AE47_9SPHI|nr:hypothetical protein [Mucilaginibacter phyllosphaerae]MBB3971222.1 hypothetical protein [Mucilaginibacter phyllosphaerae]TEW66877.1 hypothetical protein E2R65_10715 [Mucilaginibacter phyllosphaerae]GGH12497.1 hypothetical protein GCM10007352_19310 [Mucilaginibacter phyllosphaerae]
MKHLSLLFFAGLLVVSSAFAPVADPIYPELAQAFKQIKKNSAITDDRQEVLYGIQQLGIVTKGKKQPVIVEFVGNDGFSAPIAKAVLKSALASYGINDVKIFVVGAASSAKVAPALAKLGFKISGEEAKYNDQGGSVTMETSPSNPQAIHVLAQESAASLLTSPDKFAVKLKYTPLAMGATDEQYEAQAKLITLEMLFAASKFKENWK